MRLAATDYQKLTCGAHSILRDVPCTMLSCWTTQGCQGTYDD